MMSSSSSSSSSQIDATVKNTIRKKKINDLAKSIRKKYLALKLGKTEEDEALQKLFNPVAEPLKDIITTSHSINKKIDKIKKGSLKKEVKEEEEEEDKKAKRELIKKNDSDKSFNKTKFLPLEDIASTRIHEDDNDAIDEFEEAEESRPYKSLSDETIHEYLDQYPPVAQKYIAEHLENDDLIDNVYGPVYDSSTSSWLLGRKGIDFDRRTGNIIIDGFQFKGTPGLYQLIFYHDPSFNNEDKSTYKQILELTGVHKDTLNRLKGSSTYKYREIIRPMFFKSSRGSQRGEISTASATGRGLLNDNKSLIYNDKPMEFLYWDDPNELVDRLKLLVASTHAGNTSHNNEIIAIIAELKEAKIIR